MLFGVFFLSFCNPVGCQTVRNSTRRLHKKACKIVRCLAEAAVSGDRQPDADVAARSSWWRRRSWSELVPSNITFVWLGSIVFDWQVAELAPKRRCAALSVLNCVCRQKYEFWGIFSKWRLRNEHHKANVQFPQKWSSSVLYSEITCLILYIYMDFAKH